MNFLQLKKIFAFIFVFIVLPGVTQAGKSAIGDHGAVSTAHPIASQLACAILQSGGNAVDAAVAAAFALSVVEPHASGLGGGGGLLIYLADQNKSTYIDYYVCAGSQFDLDFDRQNDYRNARSVLVPGTVAGLNLALEKYGTKKLSELLGLVADRLDSGFVMDEVFYEIILDLYDLFEKNPRLGQLYLNQGVPREIGSQVLNPLQVAALRKIAEQGPSVFYEGEIADSIVAVVQRGGGFITRDDLKNYRPIEREPVQGEYRGLKVLSSPPPQCGAMVIESLQIFEFLDLQRLGSPVDSWKTLHFFIETFKRTDADRNQFVGDPLDFALPADLLSENYARDRFLDIDPQKATPAETKLTEPGSPGKSVFASKKQAKKRLKTQRKSWYDNPEDPGSTTHLSVCDAAGNAVSLTQTLNLFWASGVVVEGFVLNNGMVAFSSANEVNQVGPNRRPRSTISPTIVLKNKKPHIITGSPGASQIPTTVVEVISNVIDFQMGADSANAAPRFNARKFNEFITVEDRFPALVIQKLEALGHNLQMRQPYDLYFGGVQLIIVDPKTGMIEASADPRRNGSALAY